MDVTALAAFLARTQLVRPEAAGVDVDRWRDAALDVELVKALHRAVVGDQGSVRRVLADGSVALADAQPGHVRTKPQAFRLGDHSEPAWEQGKLKAGLVELCRDIAPLLTREPMRAAADLAWTLCRAQSFTGLNERLALVVASWVCRRAGVPALDVERLERDDAFAVAATADRDALERYLVDAVWDEALALVEAAGPVAPQASQRWTLADDHGAAKAMRESAAKVADLDVVVDHVATSLEHAHMLTNSRRVTHPQAAWHAAVRGRFICPHEPLTTVRWAMPTARDLELVFVVGATGRGTTGAVSAYIALELAGQPAPRTAVAMLLIPDESHDERQARASRWLDGAVPRVLARSPARI